MTGFWTVCKRELKGYFATPVAYVFLIIFRLPWTIVQQQPTGDPREQKDSGPNGSDPAVTRAGRL